MSTEQQQSPLLEPFVWGNGGKRKTPEQIEADKKLALLLMKGGTDYSPIQHWTQGGARVMQALAGVMRERRAEQSALANANASSQNITAMLAGLNQNQQQAAPAAAPNIPTPQTQSPFAPPPTPQAESPFSPPPDLSKAPDVPQMTESDAAPQAVQPSMTESPVQPMANPTEMQQPPQQQSNLSPDAVAPNINRGPSLNLDPQSVGRIKKTLLTEVIAGLPDGAYNPQAAGIVDTIMNRVVSGQWGNNVKSVVNAPYQFSDINGPVSWRRHGRNDVDQITDGWLQSPAGQRASKFVDEYLAKRSGNAQEAPYQAKPEGSQHFGQLVGGHLNYANPHYSDASNLAWINKLDGPVLGMGTAIHRHGTAGNNKPVDATYAVNLTGQQQPQQANPQTAPLFIGDSHARALAQFGQGQNMGVNGAHLSQILQQLQNAPQNSRVVMSAGTNDAVGNWNEQTIRQQVAQAAEIAKARGLNLTWAGPTGAKGATLDAILADATKQHGINYRSMQNQNFAMQPDGIHAQINPQGYGAMWNAINQQPQAQPQVQPFKPFDIAGLGAVDANQFLQNPVGKPLPDGVDPQSLLQNAPQTAALSQEQNPQQFLQNAENPQVAQAGNFDINNLNFRAPNFAQQPPVMPQQAPQQQQAPVAPPQNQQKQIDPRIINSLTSPYASAQEKSIAMELLKPHITPSQQQFTPLPNGMVLRKNPRDGSMQIVNPYNGQVVTDPNQIPQGLRNTQFGVTPQFGYDKDGNPVALQFGNDGTVKQPTLPNGVTLSKTPIKVEGPTGTTLIDPITRQQVGFIPKDIVGANRDKQIGEQQGKDIAQLPSLLGKMDTMLQTVDGLLNDPGLDYSTGFYSKLPTIPGTSQARFRSREEQLRGQAFLQAYGDLRGTGAISEIEGTKATAAIARLNTAQSAKDYREALNELKGVITSARERAIKGAGQQQQQQAPQMQQQTAPQAPRRLKYNPSTGNLE